MGFSRIFDRRIEPLLSGIFNLSIFHAIRSALAATMPFVLLGSFAILLNNFPLPAYQEKMLGLFGPGWKNFGGTMWNATFGVMSLIMAFGISQFMAEQHNRLHPTRYINPAIAGLVGFGALMGLFEMPSGQIPQMWTGVAGLFVAILVSVLASRLMLALGSIKKLRLHLLAGSPDQTIPQSFEAMIPGAITVAVFACAGAALSLWEVSLHGLIHDILRYPFERTGDTLGRGLLYTGAIQVLWFFGVHGANVLDPITHGIYETMMAANVAAAAAGDVLPHVVTKTFLDCFVFIGGTGATISLAVALLVFSQTPERKRLALLALLPGIFNINELLIFGLPVILNPIMLLPFVLGPLILGGFSYLVVSLGIVPGTSVAVDWVTPVLYNSYLATGSLSGTVLQALNIILGVLIYAPFVVLSDRFQSVTLAAAFQQLFKRACTYVTGPTGQRCLDRADAAGSLARGLVVDLEEAFDRDRGLYLEFQPQIAATAHKVMGVEALMRWEHPRLGNIPAPITVALAEDAGLIHRLGDWVLDNACATRRKWLDKGIGEIVVGVNLSAMQIDAGLPLRVAETLKRHDLPESLLELEVTESAGLDLAGDSTEILKKISQAGVSIAIDDFGMGHTSLRYLKDFSVSTVKIDGSITRDVNTNPINSDIVATIAELCHARNINCVAEFVERAEQIATLLRLGCNVFQGYYFSKPLRGTACFGFIRDFGFGRPSINGKP